MNNRVKTIVGEYSSGKLSKKAELATGDIFNIPKSLLLTAIGIASAAGIGTGAAIAKTTESTETDYENAQKAFSVGNLESSVISNMQKLKAERERQKQIDSRKTMRLV